MNTTTNFLNSKIDAIKLLRAVYPIGLADAKYTVEEWMRISGYTDVGNASFEGIMVLLKIARKVKDGVWTIEGGSIYVKRVIEYSDIKDFKDL